ncbi:hypothetical protein [Rickettsiella endosymbiont of Dermanyssus gallinae]|uniref:hypothetical protein n=1 Tax=Rickettsiella endosymbiont of Dermanyssus gallinae TaxID=2856608 RepID=UPI001C52C00A|nr:hypothetical protein [Rickettsiella endosymbiont of Dermanyssus gallinae]
MFQPALIIKCINAYTINTKISPIGYCQGLASMARDAFLLGPDEYQRYQTRLDYMKQNNFLYQMQDFIQTAQLLTAGDIKICEIPTGKLKQWSLLKQYAAISLNKPESTVNTEDFYSVYLETRAFLETMTILFEPNK